MQMKAQMVEESRPLVDSLLKKWLDVRKYLRLAMSSQPITREQDQAFLETKSAISRLFSQVRNRIPRQLTGPPERLQNIMKQALSVTHVRNMPEPDRRQLYALWHQFYVELCRTTGALKYMGEHKYFPKFEEKMANATANIKANIANEHSGKKRRKRRS